MKVKEYIQKRQLGEPSKGACPIVYYSQYPILYKMAVECCESSQKGDCFQHFLNAELGNVKDAPK